MSYQTLTPKACAKKIADAKTILILTGAGLSTAAGVPDFRGPNGLYVTRAYDPEKVFEISGFDRDPRPFYQFSRDFLGLLKTIRPTFTHRFLAALERHKPSAGLVTQNIDGLHQRAGSQRVMPIHGDYETAHCRQCGRGYAGTRMVAMLDEMEVPMCGSCGGVIKPDIVFFGENVRHLDEAGRLATAADLALVLGSSLTVYPAAMLPEMTGGEVAIISQGPVGMRPGERVFLADADLDDFFRDVAGVLGWELPEAEQE